MSGAKAKPNFEFMLRHPAHVFALGFGSGLLPKAPGTFGTLAAIPFWLLIASLPLVAQLAVVIAGFFVGIWFCQITSDNLGVHDHGGIVWDEFIGLWLTLLFIPSGWTWLLAGFLLFRVFDILKPWPIKYFDQKVHGGLGVMIDDVIAGLFAGVILLIVSQFL